MCWHHPINIMLHRRAANNSAKTAPLVGKAIAAASCYLRRRPTASPRPGVIPSSPTDSGGVKTVCTISSVCSTFSSQASENVIIWPKKEHNEVFYSPDEVVTGEPWAIAPPDPHKASFSSVMV